MWYTARLIIRCEVKGLKEDSSLTDEQVRLIKAESADEAYEKALILGEGEEYEYINSLNEKVRWVFAGIAELEEIGKRMKDGIELSSKRSRVGSVEKLIRPKEQLTVFFREN